MNVAPGTIVTLSFDITDDTGEIVESSEISGPVTFMHGVQAIIPGLNAKLEGLAEGAEATFEFTPEEAFGRPEDAPIKAIPRSEFPAQQKVEVGLRFEAGMPGGQTVVLEVVDSGETEVQVRMIHPLAGKKIGMSVRILGVREATKAEQEAGRPISRPPPPPKK
jgi:FKBP-type peptidyl-prolyl cis-trans isomerase SlyD